MTGMQCSLEELCPDSASSFSNSAGNKQTHYSTGIDAVVGACILKQQRVISASYALQAVSRRK